jgi:hypothetical protein
MAALSRRISDLEAQAASTEHRVRVYFRDEGEVQMKHRNALILAFRWTTLAK